MKSAKEIKAKVKELEEELEKLEKGWLNQREMTRRAVLIESIRLLKWSLKKSRIKANSEKVGNIVNTSN